MKIDLSRQTIDIPCPHCGHKIRETIGKLQSNPKLTCPSCSRRVDVDATQMRQKIDSIRKEAEKSISDALGKLGRLGK